MVFPLCVSSHDQKYELSLRKPCHNSNINMVFPQCVSSNVSYDYYSVKNPCPSGCICTVFSRMFFLRYFIDHKNYRKPCHNGYIYEEKTRHNCSNYMVSPHHMYSHVLIYLIYKHTTTQYKNWLFKIFIITFRTGNNYFSHKLFKYFQWFNLNQSPRGIVKT